MGWLGMSVLSDATPNPVGEKLRADNQLGWSGKRWRGKHRTWFTPSKKIELKRSEADASVHPTAK